MSGASWKIPTIFSSPSPSSSSSSSSSSFSSPSPIASPSPSSSGFCFFRRSVVQSSCLPCHGQYYRHDVSASSQINNTRRPFEYAASRPLVGQLHQDGNTEALRHHHHRPVVVYDSFPVLKVNGRLRDGGASADYNNYSKDHSNHHGRISRKNSLQKEPSLLLSLIQEIQPLDVCQISVDASRDSTDAMKRTISGMLGLLPSDQFHVTVESSRDPLAKLLVSSIMTGYTLRNAEYRLCLQKSLGSCDDDESGCWKNQLSTNSQKIHLNYGDGICENQSQEEESNYIDSNSLEYFHEGQQLIDDDAKTIEALGFMSEETRKYILNLKGKLNAVTKELENRKQINTGLQMQNIVGEEKNDLLDYLRSLSPDKVAELSQPTSKDVDEVIEHVINGLLDDPSIKLQHKEDTQYTISSGPWDEDNTQKCSSSPLQSQSALIVERDYLARLLFWCMLLGHHMRSVEYRLELSRTLSLSGDLDNSINGD